MRYPVLLSLVALLACGRAAPPELAARPGNLHGEWRFRTDPDDAGEAQGWQRADHDDSAWRTIAVPGYWEPQGVTDPRPGRPPTPPAGAVRYTDYDGVAWYRTRVTLPPAWRGRPLELHLAQVDDQDRSYVNGTLVGETGPGVEQPVAVWRRYPVPAELAGESLVIAVRVTDLGGPGGLQGPMLALLPADFTSRLMTLPSENRPAAERFADPPGSARILPIRHRWPDDPEAARMQLATDLANGFGGAATNVDFRGYLEDEAAWARLRDIVTTAREAGASLWLYDEEGYPSGAAGGIVLRDHPEYEARGLLVAEAVSRGEAVELTAPPGRVVMAVALPLGDDGVDLTRAVPLTATAGGPLRFEPRGGEWLVQIICDDVLYEGTHATNNVFRDRRVPNLLVAEATDYFLRVTHDRYAERFGANLGDTFVSTFTDEPSLMSVFLKPMPYRPLPWSPDLPRAYQARWGEEIWPILPLLAADGPGAGRARYRYWQLIAETTAANYFGVIRRWCEAHGLRSGGHLLYEEPLLMHVPFYGDFMASARELTAPSIDCLTSLPETVPQHIGKLVASAGELEQNTVTMSEASDFAQRYRPAGDTRPLVQVSEAQIRGSLHRQQISGINTFTSYYTWDGRDQAELRRLNEQIGRVNTLIRGGHLVADVAVVYPVNSVWPHYRPRQHLATDAPGAVAIAQAFQSAVDQLFGAGRDYCLVDARGLAEATVEGDTLVHGDLRWRVLVLPGVETLPAAAWAQVAAFARGGGAVVALGPRPRNSEAEFPSPAVQALGEELFGAGGRGVWLDAGEEILLAAVVDGLLERDVSWQPAGPLRTTHRRVEEHDLWLVINDGDQPWSGTITVAGEGEGELWDPVDGSRRPIGDGTVTLPEYGAMIVRYPAARERQRREGGAPARPALRALSFEAVTVGHGEQVDGELSEGRIEGDLRAWTAVGRLTRGEIDTHLMVQFRLPAPLDLSATDWLVVDTWVPDGQESGPNLLVVAADADGSVFLAEAGRSLGRPGKATAYVPWSRFTPLGQQGGDGRLDRSKIVAITVGWGGHIGREGDRIEFTCTAPMTATAPR